MKNNLKTKYTKILNFHGKTTLLIKNLNEIKVCKHLKKTKEN